jgi:adenylate kinase family enzyme
VNPRRIVLLGCGGSGKTTLGARVAERIGAPLICLDALWKPDWGPESLPGFRRQVAEAHAGEAWVSDGNFAQATFDIRLPRAELIVWLETPRLICAWRAVRRPFRAGEPHRLEGLLDVLRFIWRFDRVNRPRIEALRETIAPATPVQVLRGGDVSAFLAALA